MPVRHFYLLPHYSCNGLFFLFSVCWLHMNEFNSFLGGIKGEKSEGCGLFWYCLRDVVNDDKMISQLSLYMVNLSLYIKVTTLFFVKWQSSFSLLLVKSEKIIFGRYIFRASRNLSDLFPLSLPDTIAFIPSGAKTQKKEILPYPRCDFGAYLRCGWAS